MNEGSVWAPRSASVGEDSVSWKVEEEGSARSVAEREESVCRVMLAAEGEEWSVPDSVCWPRSGEGWKTAHKGRIFVTCIRYIHVHFPLVFTPTCVQLVHHVIWEAVSEYHFAFPPEIVDPSSDET